jgi:endonuclease G
MSAWARRTMGRPRVYLGTLAALVLASVASAQHESTNCLGGCPEGSPEENILVEREIYTLSASPETRFSDWVAYKVTKASQAGSRSERRWKEDPELNGIGLEPLPRKEDDYRGAFAALGTNRGHQAPLAAFTGTPHWRDTNFLRSAQPRAVATS